MTAPHGQGPPRSTVADVMAIIRARYAAVSDPAKVLIGERHLPQINAPPRIVLVRSSGEAGGPSRVGDGNVASFAQDFIAYVWAVEAVDDVQRYAALDAMLDRFVNAVRATIAGRASITMLDPADTSVQTFGEQMRVRVTWTRSVPKDAAIWAVDVTAVSPPDPMRPQGDTGKTFEIQASTEGSR